MVYELEKEHKQSSLTCKKKEELVKEIMRLEHNVNVLNERLNVQANAIKHYEKKSRNKAIDEFAEMIELEMLTILTSEQEYQIVKKSLYEIAEQLKGGE